MKVVVGDIVQDRLALFQEEGQELYKILSKEIEKGVPTCISFEGIDRCATAFLNEAVGHLYINYDKEIVDRLLSFDYANVYLLKEKIADVRLNALNPKEYDSIVRESYS